MTNQQIIRNYPNGQTRYRYYSDEKSANDAAAFDSAEDGYIRRVLPCEFGFMVQVFIKKWLEDY